MGKRNCGPRHKWRNNKKHKENVWRTMEECPRESELFENYYRLQQIVPEDEWDQFIQTLKRDLPTTFRINEADPNYEIIKNNLKTKYHFEGTVEYEGQQIGCVHPIDWYENEGAWQIDLHRKKLRKVEAFKELHKYMIALNLSGHIGRQEAVSMLPPMFLDVQKDDIVLDMCAAPGSKTLQILEKVHKTGGNGIVVANDADNKRAYLLVHQVNHLKSSHIIVTTHLGQQYPFLRFDSDSSTPSTSLCQSGSFDKVLCDVPCSGDGTLRKAPEMWKKWNIKYSLALHPLQLAITLRGLKLLKVGGRLVYSTCSLNPIEDEAVVMALIRRCGGAVRIVDVRSLYPKLRRSPGCFQWKVVDQANKVYDRFDDIPENNRRLYRDTMFPPSQRECEEAHIDWAMRFLPHQQDTGGFFVCVLEKIKDIPKLDRDDIDNELPKDENETPKNEEEASKEENGSPNVEENPQEEEASENEELDGDLVGIVKSEQQSLAQNRKYDVLIPWNKQILPELKSFYGISDDFDWDLIYSRSENHHILLYVNPVINELCVKSRSAKRLKIVNTGLKLFEYNSRKCECAYRICQEGLPVIRKFMTKRIISVCLQDYLLILETQKNAIEATALTEETQQQLNEIEVGACIFELNEAAKEELSKDFPTFKEYFDAMGCVVWRGTKNINILVTEVDIDTMRRVLTMKETS